MRCHICNEHHVDCSCARKALRRLVEAYRVHEDSCGQTWKLVTPEEPDATEAWAEALRVLGEEADRG